MGILKEAGETIVKYGEIVVNKTEELARIARINLDIKRLGIDLGIAEKETGRHVIAAMDGGAATIDCKENKITELYQKVNSLKRTIEEKKSEIERIKAESKAAKSADVKPEPPVEGKE
jgi:hypothetical protein